MRYDDERIVSILKEYFCNGTPECAIRKDIAKSLKYVETRGVILGISMTLVTLSFLIVGKYLFRCDN